MTTLAPGDWRLAVYGGRGSNTEQRRQGPRKADRERIVAIQGDKCLYCGIPIGTTIKRHKPVRRGYAQLTTVTLRRNWDHFVPYSFVVQNPGANWVLACHVCNLIKHARMFDTVDDARSFVLPRREELGYETARAGQLRGDVQVLKPAEVHHVEPDVPSVPVPRPRAHLDSDTVATVEAAALLGVNPETLSMWRRAGKAPAWRWGRYGIVFSRASVNEWIRNRTQ